ncbi:type VI secretion system baseplate subunit TssE [Pusillimonas sp. SM2304]|uniref:type VI secretion system baseplate subunit TssE n=1 Tax=Pusillimonas sp. SM2304 TaxID=3073241 RepID=UPI0028742CFC|nr:type VI secretion system baseplate subunit TssE [Pusillimonas sp. SM2304]MDS1142257.1 type VI secretion system baseplate subunit TssE [Pusillimonas sp. SM2304]
MTVRSHRAQRSRDKLRGPGDDPRIARDRLQPALLDRLTDDMPGRRGESRHEMLTHAQLRLAVLRDLSWLLNTVSIESSHDLGHCAHVRTSALNFGVRALAGKRMSEVDWVDLERAITEAIVHFEPRILAETIMVQCMTDADVLEHHNMLSFKIKGLLWCVPYPQEFLFRTVIDLESGHIDLSDMGTH